MLNASPLLAAMLAAQAPTAPAPAADAPSVTEVAEPAPPAVPTGAEPRGLEARTRVLSDAVAFELKRLPGDHRIQTFAVVPFEELGPQAQDKRLGLVVSDVVATHLVRHHNLPLVERAALNKIFEEQALGQSGAIDEKQAANVGKISGARALVIGSVSDVADGFRVSVRCVDAETASILSTSETTLPADELIAFSANAVVLKSRSGALFRSLIVPGWGQLYNDQPVKAAALGGLTAVLALGTLTTLGVGVYDGYVLYPQIGTRPEDKKDPSLVPAAAKSTREKANAELSAAGVLAGVTAVAWGITALDAWLSGHDVESADAATAIR